MILTLSLLACGQGALSLNPIGIDWGEVDFQDDACRDCDCEAHCAPWELTLTNTGDAPLSVTLPDGLESERFCLVGFEDVSEPITIPTLEPEDTYLLTLSICGYKPGEQTLTMAGEIQFVTDGIEPFVNLAWSYTPIRDQALR